MCGYKTYRSVCEFQEQRQRLTLWLSIKGNTSFFSKPCWLTKSSTIGLMNTPSAVVFSPTLIFLQRSPMVQAEALFNLARRVSSRSLWNVQTFAFLDGGVVKNRCTLNVFPSKSTATSVSNGILDFFNSSKNSTVCWPVFFLPCDSVIEVYVIWFAHSFDFCAMKIKGNTAASNNFVSDKLTISSISKWVSKKFLSFCAPEVESILLDTIKPNLPLSFSR